MLFSSNSSKCLKISFDKHRELSVVYLSLVYLIRRATRNFSGQRKSRENRALL